MRLDHRLHVRREKSAVQEPRHQAGIGAGIRLRKVARLERPLDLLRDAGREGARWRWSLPGQGRTYEVALCLDSSRVVEHAEESGDFLAVAEGFDAAVFGDVG